MGYFMTIWYILCSFGTFFAGFGVMHQEKSGNPASKTGLPNSKPGLPDGFFFFWK
jgi:hypothetical protein